MGGYLTSTLCLALAAIVLQTTTHAKSVHQTIDAKKPSRSRHLGCPTPDKTLLLPGQEKLYIYPRSCTLLRCTEEEGLITDHRNCDAPRCVDPKRKPGACCLSCLEGEDCRLPSGEVIKAEKGYKKGTVRCHCPKDQNGKGWEDDLTSAICVPVTSDPGSNATSSPTCRLEDGSELRPGQFKIEPQDYGCRKQKCDNSSQIVTIYGRCRRPSCPNPVRQPDACCRTCPGDGELDMQTNTSSVSQKNATEKRQTMRFYKVDWITLLRLLFFGSFQRTPQHHHHHYHHGSHHSSSSHHHHHHHWNG